MPTVNSIVSTFRTAINYSQSNTIGQDPKWSPTLANTIKITNGTGLNQANRAYSIEGTLTASATVTFNVSTGLTDVFGNAIALTRVCEILVEHLNESASTSTITVGGGSNPIFTTMAIPIKKNGDVHVRDYSATGIAISTNVNLKLTNDSGALVASYRVTIIGSQ